MIDSIKMEMGDMKGWLQDIRGDFHQYPELGYKEFRTSEKIQVYLNGLGVDFTLYPGSTAVVALIKGSAPGKTVAIRGDMDALPITQKNNVPYRSKNEGVMHACGHDAHTTMVLGAAKYFAENKERLKGNIKLLFQPAEESVGGALDMVRAGCMENPTVDHVIGLHVTPDLPTGWVRVKYGVVNGASDTLDIKVSGQKAHGAYPEKGIDAIMISANVINALQTVISRNISPLDSAVLSIGTIQGGTAGNIIADEVNMRATLRTLDNDVREKVKGLIKRTVKGVCEALGGCGQVKIEKGYDPVINHEETLNVAAQAAKDLFGEHRLLLGEKPSLGVEDFGYFAAASKGAYYNLGCGNKEKGIVSPIHTNTFDIDEDCLVNGAALHVLTALRLLQE